MKKIIQPTSICDESCADKNNTGCDLKNKKFNAQKLDAASPHGIIANLLQITL